MTWLWYESFWVYVHVIPSYHTLSLIGSFTKIYMYITIGSCTKGNEVLKVLMTNFSSPVVKQWLPSVSNPVSLLHLMSSLPLHDKVLHSVLSSHWKSIHQQSEVNDKSLKRKTFLTTFTTILTFTNTSFCYQIFICKVCGYWYVNLTDKEESQVEDFHLISKTPS